MDILWTVIFIAFVILELCTTQFVCIWFAGGALCSLICAVLNLSLTVQLAVFVIASALLLIFTGKFVKKLKKGTDSKTNIDALIGKDAIVTEDISNIESRGFVKVGGITWSARSVDGNDIPASTCVKIKEIDGVKLLVEQIN